MENPVFGFVPDAFVSQEQIVAVFAPIGFLLSASLLPIDSDVGAVAGAAAGDEVHLRHH